jgi:hypothetical protein
LKHPIIFAITLFHLSCFGQTAQNQPAQAETSGFQLGIHFSPDVCYRTLKNNDGSTMSDAIIQQRNENEIFKLGYTLGLTTLLPLNKHISLESGITYSNKGYQTTMQVLYYFQYDPAAPQKMKSIYNNHYIDIPFKANFILGKKKLRFISSLGLTTNVFIRETSTSVLVYSDRTERNSSATNFKYNRLNLSPSFGLGIDYQLNDKMNFRIQPSFSYSLLKIIDAPVTAYLYSGGIYMSYFFKL